MKKAIHKLLAVLVAACMCTSLVPAAALGAPSDTGSDSGSSGVTSLPSYDGATATDPNVFDAVGNNRATATTEVYTIIRDTNFTFENVSLGRNFTSPQNAIDMTAASESLPNGPLTATFRGSSDYYRYLWTIVEVDTGEDGATIYKPHETSATFQGPSNDTSAGGTFGTIDPEGNRIGTFVDGTVDQGAIFNHSITTADGLEQDKTYLYTLYLDSNNGTGVEAKAQITVTIYADYAQMSLYAGEDSNPPSIMGYLYKPFGTAPELSAQDIGESSPIYSAIANAAGAASPACGFGTPQNLVITNIDSKPADKAAYQNDLQVHLPVPVVEDVEFNVGDSVPLFYYDPVTKEATKKTGTVVQQTDSKGNPVTVDGQPVLAVEYTLTGDLASGGADLGVFAVGYEIEVGAFSVDSSAGEGGSISPSGSNTYPVGESPKYLLYPLDGYAIKGVTLTCDGTAVSVVEGTLIGNAFTFDPASYSISKGQQWTIKAEFEKPTPDQDEYSVRGTVKGVGSGTMTFTSAAPGSEPHEVAMGQTLPADGEDPIMLPSSAGVNVVFNPGLGYRLKTFTINGTPYQVNGSSYYISTLTTGITLEAEYEEGTPDPAITRDVNFEVEGGDAGHGQVMGADGAYCTSGVMTANFGGSVTLTLKPQEEYMVSKVMAYNLDEGGDPITPGTDLATQAVKDGSATDEVYNLQVNNVLQHMKIVVSFTLAGATVDIKNLKTDVGGTVNYVGAQKLETGKPLHLVITPNAPGYTVGKVTLADGNGTPQDMSTFLTERDGGAYYTVNLVRADNKDTSYGNNGDGTTDKVIYITKKTATLEIDFDSTTPPAPAYVTIATEVDSTGGGSVTPTQEVLNGQDVDIFFFPDANKTIGKVEVDGFDATATVDQSTGKLTLKNVQENHTVKVTFTDGDSPLSSKKRYTLHPSSGIGGSISPSAEVMVYEGQSQKFSFIPATGYELHTIRIDGTAVSLTEPDYNKDKLTYTCTPTGDKTDINIVGTFQLSEISGDEKPTYTIDISAGDHGKVSPSGLITVARGTMQPITIIPEDGYHVDKVWQGLKGAADDDLVNMVGGVTNGVYSLYDVQADMVIKVEFAEGTDDDQPSTDPSNMITLGNDNAAISAGVTVTPPVAGSVFYKEMGTDHANVPAEFTISLASGYKLDGVTVNGNPLTPDKIEDGIFHVVIPKEQITQDMVFKVLASPEKPSTDTVDTKTVTLEVTGNGIVSPSGTQNKVLVETGASQTFSFIPGAGNKVGTVKVNSMPVTYDRVEVEQGGQTAVAYSYTINSISRDTRLEVEFVEDPTAPPPITPYEVSVVYILGDNGQQNGFSSISAGDGAAKVLPGNDVSITFKPAQGYETHVFKATTKEECIPANDVTSQLSGGTLTLKNVQASQQYAVWFMPLSQEIVYHNVVAQDAEHGSIQPSGTTTVVSGTDYSFTLVGATEGTTTYVPSKVWVTRAGAAEEEVWASAAADGTSTVEGIVLDKDKQSFTVQNISSDVTLRAEFEPGTPSIVTVPIVATAGAGGTVSPSDPFEAATGSTAQITVTPNAGYVIDTVTDTIGTNAPLDVTAQVKAASGVYEFTVTTNPAGHKIEATFKKDDTPNPDRDFYNVFVSHGTGGTVSPQGVVVVPSGGSVALTFVPDEGYKVAKMTVSADGKAEQVLMGNRFDYFLADVKEDTNVYVEFELLAGGETINTPTFYNIEATSSVNGTISPNGTVKVADGKMAKFSFIPDTDCKLSYLVVDGEDVPATSLVQGQYTFSSVKEDHTIHAVFCGKDETAAEFVTVNASNSAGGSITPVGAKLVRKGQSAAYTVAPYFGYQLSDIQLKVGTNGTAESIFPDNPAGGKNTADITKPGVLSWANGTLTLLNVQEDTNVIATFTKKDTSGEDPEVHYSTIKMDVGPNGTTSLPNGTSVIEALPVDGSMSVSVFPDDGYAIDYIESTYANGSTHKTTAAEARSIWTSGYFTLTATQVNYETSITVRFREQTDAEKGQINDGTLTPAASRTITATATGRGQITPKGNVKVSVNAPITFSLIPVEGYELSSLKVDGTDKMSELTSNTRSYTIQPGTNDVTIEAAFSLIQGSDEGVNYVLTAKTSGTGGAGGTVSVESQKIPAGGNGVVYFVPNDTSKLVRVGVKVGNGEEAVYEHQMPEYRISNITADTTVTGYFEPLGPDETPVKIDLKDMFISVAPSGGGTVSPADSGNTPAARIPAGAEQVISLFPDAGYEVNFIVVNGKADYVNGNIRNYSVIADRNEPQMDVEVYFKKVEGESQETTVTTKVSTTVNGSVTGSGGAEVSPQQQTVSQGQPAIFYIRANKGQTIYAVYVDKDGTKHYIAIRGVSSNSTTIPSDEYWTSIQSGQGAQTTGVAGEQRDAFAAGLYAGGAMIAPAVYRGDAGLTPAAVTTDGEIPGSDGANDASNPATGGKYYELYEVEIPWDLLQQLMDPVTGEVEIQVEMREIGKDEAFEFVSAAWYGTGIWTNTGGMTEPTGEGFMAWDATQNMRVTTFKGYYLDYITRTYTYEDGPPVVDDITGMYTGSASSGNVMLTFGEGSGYDPDTDTGKEPTRMDINVYFKRMGETSFVTVGLGDVTGPTGTGGAMVDIKNQVTVEPSLVGPDGKPAQFIRDTTGNGEPQKFVFTPDTSLEGPHGRPLILDTVTYNGKPVSVSPGSNEVNVRLTANGKFNVTFREADEGEVPIEPTRYTVKGTVGSGQGTVSTETIVDKGRTAQVGFEPAEGWMLDQENSYDEYADDDGVVRKHELLPEGLANDEGVYNIFNIDRDHNVSFAFVEAVEVDIQWTNGDHGYVTPNTMLGGTLQWQKGVPIPFIVAPYVNYDVESFTVKSGTTAEEDKCNKLVQNDSYTQALMNKMAEDGLNFTVKSTTNGTGVQGSVVSDAQEQSVQPLAQAARAENGTLYGTSPRGAGNEAKAKENFNYAYGYTAPITGNTTVRASWTREPEPPAPTYTITAEIVPDSNGNLNGTIDGQAGPVVRTDQPAGQSIFFTPVAANGYQLQEVTTKSGIEGIVQPSMDGKNVIYGPIQGDDTVYFQFAPIVPGGPQDWITRTLRTLRALAQTGDLTAPLLIGLLAVAGVAVVGATVTGRRSRKQQRAHR